MKLEYRADLDGLRAIAVLAVVMNHTGIRYFSGGYIGVDIFFVISGFLITTIIAREIQENKFTLSRFYERRIRRILPALAVMVIGTFLISAVIYDSERFKSFGKSLLATMLFYSNINFWKEAGYFDAPSLLKPLLHTWSLAVEEQFYIVFPLFMYAISFYARKSVKLILVIVAFISLGFSIYAVNSHDATSAFYLAHMRAWELLVGGLLALNIFPAAAGRGINTALGLIGALMIGISVFQYTENTPFPGLSAAVPVLGTALIVYSSMTNYSLIGKVLGFPPLVFIGKISYSLYLWHWPLIIFAKYYLIRTMTGIELFIVLAIIFGVSTISWRFIETPFRSRSFLSARQIYAFGVSTMMIIAAAAGVVYYFDGFPKREGSTPLVEFLWKEKEVHTNCLYKKVDNADGFEPCVIGDKSKPKSFMMWGDSHASALRKAVTVAARNNRISGTFMYMSQCPPLLTAVRDQEHLSMPCNEFNERMLLYLKTHPEIKTIILASRWSSYVEGVNYKEEDGSRIVLAGMQSETSHDASNEALVRLGLERMIQTLTALDRKIVIVSPVPEIGYNVPSANFIAARTGRDLNQIIAPSLDDYLERNRKTFAIFNSLKEKYEFQIVDPWKVLCVETRCRATIDGLLLYSDDDHLSLFGSELVSVIFEPLFASMKQPVR
jgi:peptidoglycan/LPS O-acetylase OafA/YrhL